MKKEVTVVAPAKSPSVVIRFPEKSILKELSVEAKKNGRSRNTEIVFRLLESLKKPMGQNEIQQVVSE